MSKPCRGQDFSRRWWRVCAQTLSARESPLLLRDSRERRKEKKRFHISVHFQCSSLVSHRPATPQNDSPTACGNNDNEPCAWASPGPRIPANPRYSRRHRVSLIMIERARACTLVPGAQHALARRRSQSICTNSFQEVSLSTKMYFFSQDNVCPADPCAYARRTLLQYAARVRDYRTCMVLLR